MVVAATSRIVRRVDISGWSYIRVESGSHLKSALQPCSSGIRGDRRPLTVPLILRVTDCKFSRTRYRNADQSDPHEMRDVREMAGDHCCDPLALVVLNFEMKI